MFPLVPVSLITQPDGKLVDDPVVTSDSKFWQYVSPNATMLVLDVLVPLVKQANVVGAGVGVGVFVGVFVGVAVEIGVAVAVGQA